jgi:hypothetical protein
MNKTKHEVAFRELIIDGLLFHYLKSDLQYVFEVTEITKLSTLLRHHLRSVPVTSRRIRGQPKLAKRMSPRISTRTPFGNLRHQRSLQHPIDIGSDNGGQLILILRGHPPRKRHQTSLGAHGHKMI